MLFDITGPSAPYILLIFGFLALLVVNLLLGVVEGVILTLLGWNPFPLSMKVSFIMNVLSGIVTGSLLILLQRTPFIWIPISFLLSLIIEGFILVYFKRGSFRQNVIVIILANLASYILLILPAYYFGAQSLS